MRYCSLAALLCFMSWTSEAQELAEGYTETGRMTVVIGGEAFSMVSAEEVSSGRSMSSMRYDNEGRTVRVSAGVIDASGLPNSPIVTLQIGPFSESLPSEMTFEFYSGEGILAANNDTETRLALVDATVQEDGYVQFDFMGEVLPTEIKNGIAAPIPDGTPRSVSGSFAGYVRLN